MGRPSIASTANPFSYRAESNGFCKGPRRVACFCFLGVLTPAILVSIPLLMRFVVFGSASYHLNPSDMRILDHRISTLWCKSEAVRVNTSFTAFVTDGEPELVKSIEPLTIQKNLIVPDDHKEYWGFYLLKGSLFRISACSRHKGGTLLIVKGRQHLQHCAYIGNEDSDQDSDENSDSSSHERNPPDKKRPLVPKRVPPTTSQEEMSIILTQIRAYVKKHPQGRSKLKQNLSEWMLLNQTSAENTSVGNATDTDPAHVLAAQTDIAAGQVPAHVADVQNDISIGPTHAPQYEKSHDPTHSTDLDLDQPATNTSTEQPHKIRHAKSRGIRSLVSAESGRIYRNRRNEADVRKNSESGEDGAFEDLSDSSLGNPDPIPRRKQTPTSIWEKEHSLHFGNINQTDPNDGSDSESESSYSSSEEALAKCEGILGSYNLVPTSECGDTESGDLAVYHNATVQVSGYYYIIFGSENEKRDNLIQALFELEKYEYDLPEPMENCTDVRECRVDFGFYSNQKVVISIPQPPTQKAGIWDEFYVAESECEPRTGLYLVFVLTVPLIILLCAFQ